MKRHLVQLHGRRPMGLFKADFFRFFAIGFALGAGLMAATVDRTAAGALMQGVVPSAVAATTLDR